MSILDRVENQEVIKAAKAEILAALDVGVAAKAIRHIQRGKVWVHITEEEGEDEKIKLSGFTNVDKMIVLLDGSLEFALGGADTSFCVLTYLKSLTTTELVVSTSYFSGYNGRTSSGDISYQVIEFY